MRSALITSAVELAAEDVAGPEDIDMAWMAATGQDIGPFGIMEQLGVDHFLSILDEEAEAGLLSHDVARFAADYLHDHGRLSVAAVDRGGQTHLTTGQAQPRLRSDHGGWWTDDPATTPVVAGSFPGTVTPPRYAGRVQLDQPAVKAVLPKRSARTPWRSVMPVLAPDRQSTLSTRLLEVGGAFSSTQHDLVTLAARFEASNEWILDGAPSAAHWMADRLDVCIATAREWIRIGKALSDLPAVTAALADRHALILQGQSPHSHRHHRERNRTGRSRHHDPGRSAGPHARRPGHNATKTHTSRDARHHHERFLRWRVEPDGMVDGTFRLPPGTAAALIAAVEATIMRTPLSVTKPVTPCATTQPRLRRATRPWPSSEPTR